MDTTEVAVEVAKDEGIMLAEISNTMVDMSGDVMLPQGLDASLWEDSGVFLDEHDVAKTLGRGLAIERGENYVNALVKFAIDADPSSSLYKRATDAWAEYKSGARSKFSIGFVPLEYSTKPHVCEKYGPNCKRVISKWLLVECSAVTLPDNFGTKVLAMKDLHEIYGEKLSRKNLSNKELLFKTVGISQKASQPAQEPVIEAKAAEEPACSQEEEKVVDKPCEKDETAYMPQEEKPYPNEHAARIADPGKFEKFRRDNGAFGEGIDAIYGITSDGKAELQAIRFDKAKFTADEARAWLKEHGYDPIEFSPAADEKAVETKALPSYKPTLAVYRPSVDIAEVERKRRRGKIMLK